MVKTSIKYIIWLLLMSLTSSAQTYFYEGFEHDGDLPADWSQVTINEDFPWRASQGGHTLNPEIPGSRRPPEAFEGTYNALFEKYTNTNAITRFITPELSMDIAIKAQLRFYHAQYERDQLSGGAYNDILRVFGKHIDELDNETWVKLAEYTQEVPGWTLREINIPDSMNHEGFQIAFEGQTGPGWGVCIDSVAIVETGVIGRYVKSVDVFQSDLAYVPAGAIHNTILRIDIKVRGNQGTIKLDSLLVQNLNDENLDLPADGVKIYATNDTVFQDPVLLGSPGDFIDNEHLFTDIDYELPTGITSLWVTYDAPLNLPHELHGAVLDAKIPAGGIKVGGGAYPSMEQSPPGYRVIFESLFIDDFESENGWTFQPEFQWGEPMGMGGEIYGIPDPDFAFSGSKIIGTDLTGLGGTDGDYENGLGIDAYRANSPTISSNFFADMKLQFYRWLNIENFDTARIYYSNDNGVTWNQIWRNIGTIKDSKWDDFSISLPDEANYSDQIQLKFTLGGTDGYTTYSGWNIDNISLVGNYVFYDLAVIEYVDPLCFCNHTSEEYITVKITNYGAYDASDVPIGFSVDGGETWTMETIGISINSRDTITYTFTNPVDLSESGWYNLQISTFFEDDELEQNNLLEHDQFMPFQIAPPYATQFNEQTNKWRAEDAAAWEFGEPGDGTIIEPGNNVWGTSLLVDYQNDDSSMLEGPCFDFSGNQRTVFECKIWSQVANAGDGLTLMYTTDDGVTWNPVPGDNFYNWNWYDNVNPNPPATPGWNTSTTGWTTMRTLLPEEFATYDYVKLGFLFTSDADDVDEGFVIDDISIYEAPYNFAIDTLLYPGESCELPDTTHVSIAVKNTGPNDAVAGTEIPLKLNWKDNFVITDTLTLASALDSGSTVSFLFDTIVAMDSALDFNFEIINLYEDDPYFYGAANDTLRDTIPVIGMPQYNPFPPITGKSGVSVQLDAGSGYTDYIWGDGITTTQTYDAFAEGMYYVTVTNDEGCNASDSTEVVNSVDDIIMSAVQPIADACLQPTPESIEIEVTNNGGEAFLSGEKVPVAYQVNNQTPIEDSILLAADFNIGNTISYAFPTTVDLSEPGNYEIKVYGNIDKDLDKSNDTVIIETNTWGLPEVDFQSDTIYTANIDTLTLDAGDDLTSYLWQDGSTDRTYSVTIDVSQFYYVTVDDTHGCGPVVDSVFVNTDDVEPIAVMAPVTACEHSATEAFSVQLQNHSGNIIPAGGQIDFGIQINGGTPVTETHTLVSDISPNSSSTLNLSSTFDLSDTGIYYISVWSSKPVDNNRENDTLVTSLATLGYPDVEFPWDTLYTTRPDTVELDAGEGFASYEWSEGFSVQVNKYLRDTSGYYAVTVSNEDGCGDDADSVLVLTYDLQLVDINRPENSCALSANETIRLKVKNNGADTIFPGTIIPVAFNVNDGGWQTEDFTMTDKIAEGQQFFIQSVTEFDMSTSGVYNLEAALAFPLDAKKSNDSIAVSREVFGYPEIDVNYDTVFTANSDTVNLIVTPSIYNAYLWNVGVNNDTLNLNGLNEPVYAVTVSNINGCSTIDTVIMMRENLALHELIAPASDCYHDADESVTVRIRNNGADTLLPGTTFNIEMDEPVETTEQITLADTLFSGDTLDYTFVQTVNIADYGPHSFEFELEAEFDVDGADDLLSATIMTYGPPSITFNYDTLRSLQPDTASLIVLEEGYDSYLWDVGVDNYLLDLSTYSQTSYYVDVTDIHGCTNSDTVVIDRRNLTINALPGITDACEHAVDELLQIEILNDGFDTIFAGTSFDINLISPQSITEEITVAEDLLPGNTFQHTMSQGVDLSATGSHIITLQLNAPFDAEPADDEYSVPIETYGNPVFDINYYDLYTTQPDTVDLIVTPSTFESYLWSVGVDNDTLSLAGYDEDFYAITVTDANGCMSDDTVYVGSKNLELHSLVSPINACVHSSEEPVTVRLKNTGTELIEQGAEVNFTVAASFSINEQLTLTDDLEPGDSLDYTFDTTVDMTETSSYSFDISFTTNFDVSPDDDQLSVTVETYGPAVIELGEEITVNTIPHVINAGEGYASYLWHDGSDSQTFTIDETTISPTGFYAVTVTNSNGCEGSDSKLVHVDIIDWSADEILAPLDGCFDAFDGQLSVQISNQSVVPVRQGRSFNIGYAVNGSSQPEEMFTLSDSVYPDETYTHNFNDVAGLQPLSNSIEINLDNEADIDETNNTVSTTVMLYNPVINFANDTVKPEAFPYDLEAPAGFSSYEWSTGQSGQTLEVTTSGTYIVTAYDSHGCSDSDTVFVDNPDGIYQNSLNRARMKIWPNPASTELTIELQRKTNGNFTVELISGAGEVVWKQQMKSTPGFTIPVSSLSEGMYLIRIYDKDEYMIENIVIEK